MTFIKSTIRPIVFSVLSVLGGITLGATLVGAVTTISTNITTAGTFNADDAATFGSTVAVTGATTLASTTATSFKVGQTGTQTTRIVSGYCVTESVTFAALDTASSTRTYANCTPYTYTNNTAVTLTSSDRVFVQATSSLPFYVVLQAASSTTNAVNLSLTNTSTSTLPTAGIYTFNFWAFQNQ